MPTLRLFLGSAFSERLTLPAHLKSLEPGPEFDFPSPCAARLAQHVKISLSDCVGVEHRIGFIGRLDATRVADRAVDHKVRDMNTLRRQLARHALRKTSQGKLAHRERRGLRIALHA